MFLNLVLSLYYVLCLYFDGLRIQHNGLRCNKTDMNVNTFNYLRRSIFRLRQGQKFVAVLKVKNRGAATSQNVKNRGIVAAKIVKIAAMSRQKS